LRSKAGMARSRQRLRIVRRISPDPMRPEDWRGLQRVLGRVIARAYLADHPELLKNGRGPGHDKKAEPDDK